MSFAHPWLLLALVALVPLAVLWWRMRRRLTVGLAFSAPGERGGAIGRRARLARLLRIVGLLALLLLLVALARPRFGRDAREEPPRGHRHRPRARHLGQHAGRATLDSREQPRQPARRGVKAVGAATSSAAPRRPHRPGRSSPAERLHAVPAHARPRLARAESRARSRSACIEDGTAVGSALGTAVNRLRASTAPRASSSSCSPTGMNNAGRARVRATAAEARRRRSACKVYTIGAGTRGLAPFPSTTRLRQQVYARSQVDIDEETLQQIAATTGGLYFRATDTRVLRDIYERIDAPRSRASRRRSTPTTTTSVSRVPLAGARAGAAGGAAAGDLVAPVP